MSILDYLKGPTKEEVLENLQNKIQKGETDLLKFYELCKEHDIPGGPSVEEVNEDLKKKIDIGEFDIFKYMIFCQKHEFYVPTTLEVESHLNKLFKIDKINILTYFEICRNKNLTGGPTVDDILKNFTGQPDKLLLFACKESLTACAEAALKAGSSARAKFRALILASKEGNLVIVQLLIDHGVNIHRNQDEALRAAAYHGQLEVIELLVLHDADIHAKNEEALAFAVSCHTNNEHLEVVKYLIENGADINLSISSHSKEWRSIRDNEIKEYLDI